MVGYSLRLSDNLSMFMSLYNIKCLYSKDWSRTFFYYMNALELEDPKDLIRKLDGKVHMFRDCEKKLRVAVVKTEGNCDVMNLIDSAISRRYEFILNLCSFL